jgi:hypothetical protein
MPTIYITVEDGVIQSLDANGEAQVRVLYNHHIPNEHIIGQSPEFQNREAEWLAAANRIHEE